jgi:probable O-glycosylation ligase (exosortase A-associated)
MKQLALLVAMTILGASGALQSPFWGVLLYYTLAVLRPQHLWDWALDGSIRWSLLAALIALGSFCLHLSRIVARSSFNGMIAMIMMYGLLVMLSTITAFNPQLAQGWAIEYAKVLVIAVVASMVIEHFWQVKLLALMILLMLGYIAWEINFLYFFQGGRLNIFHYGYGGLDNNGAGLLIAMGIPFAYCFSLSPVKGIWRWWPVAAAVLGLMTMHAVMMTYSRGAMLASAVGICWVLVHHRPRWQSTGAAVGLVLVLSVMAGPEIKERFLSTTNFQTDESAQSRFSSWSAAWQIAWENPVLGKGIRNSNQYTRNFGADRQGRTIHNQYLQIAADTGIPAASLYLFMLCYGMWNFRKGRMMCRDAIESDPDDEAKRKIDHASRICLAAQASLMIFIFDGMFLSLEMFEPPWLLLVMAGVLPRVMKSHLDELCNATDEKETEPENEHAPQPLPQPRPGMAPA